MKPFFLGNLHVFSLLVNTLGPSFQGQTFQQKCSFRFLSGERTVPLPLSSASKQALAYSWWKLYITQRLYLQHKKVAFLWVGKQCVLRSKDIPQKCKTLWNMRRVGCFKAEAVWKCLEPTHTTHHTCSMTVSTSHLLRSVSNTQRETQCEEHSRLMSLGSVASSRPFVMSRAVSSPWHRDRGTKAWHHGSTALGTVNEINRFKKIFEVVTK